MQVSLGFDRAHPKVWDYFREHNTLILAFRQSAHGRLNELQEGQKVLVYIPQSQGGFGLVGVGALAGSPSVVEPGELCADEGPDGDFWAFMRWVYSDPKNKPVRRGRCSNWRFKMHRERISGKGCGNSSTPWEFGVEVWSAGEEAKARRRSLEASSVFLPMEWEATVPFEQGFFAIDFNSIGLADFPFKVCQLSNVFNRTWRRLTTEHWAVISSRLKAECTGVSHGAAPSTPGSEEESASAAARELRAPLGEAALGPEEPQAEAADPKDSHAADSDQKEEQLPSHDVDPKDPPAQSSDLKDVPVQPSDSKESPMQAAEVKERSPRPSRSASSSGNLPPTTRRRVAEMPATRHPRPAKASRSGMARTAVEGVGRRWASLGELLTSLGLGKYAEQLEAEEVDLAALRLLSDRDLADLGIPLGPRRKLQAAVGSDLE